jgi:hypothetical protein
MNNKFLFTITFLGAFIRFSGLYAQSNTRGTSPDTTLGRVGMPPLRMNTSSVPAHKILLIPFYSKMCMTEISKDVHDATHLDAAGIIEQFRTQLDLSMYLTLRKNNSTISLLQPGRYKSDSVIGYIYASTGYKFDNVPGAVPDATTDTKDKNGRYLHNGELEVPVDYSKRFMNTTISNPHLLEDLYKKYHTDTFVFINELDIKNVNNPTENLSDDTYRREVDVHYSIMDKNAKPIAKGMATTYFPFRENDPKEIGEKYFSQIAAYIVKDYAQGVTINNQNDQQKKQPK